MGYAPKYVIADLYWPTKWVELMSVREHIDVRG